MFTLEDREICKNCEYKEICAGECEKTIKGYKEIEESHRKENGKLRERVKQLEEDNKRLKASHIVTHNKISDEEKAEIFDVIDNSIDTYFEKIKPYWGK